MLMCGHVWRTDISGLHVDNEVTHHCVPPALPPHMIKKAARQLWKELPLPSRAHTVVQHCNLLQLLNCLLKEETYCIYVRLVQPVGWSAVRTWYGIWLLPMHVSFSACPDCLQASACKCSGLHGLQLPVVKCSKQHACCERVQTASVSMVYCGCSGVRLC
jgi:hypothetical protein